jgi:hypothetical protein
MTQSISTPAGTHRASGVRRWQRRVLGISRRGDFLIRTPWDGSLTSLMRTDFPFSKK